MSCGTFCFASTFSANFAAVALFVACTAVVYIGVGVHTDTAILQFSTTLANTADTGLALTAFVGASAAVVVITAKVCAGTIAILLKSRTNTNTLYTVFATSTQLLFTAYGRSTSA